MISVVKVDILCFFSVKKKWICKFKKLIAVKLLSSIESTEPKQSAVSSPADSYKVL